jgi:hypothetical protein
MGTQSDATYHVGDSFALTIKAPGYARQAVAVSENGGDPFTLGSVTGDTYTVSGAWTAANIGTYTQTWYVDGVAASPTLTFTIAQ